MNDIESIKKYQDDKKVYIKKAKALTSEFKLYLASTYPDIEKEIFSKLIPEKVGIFAASFPQIKSSETITKLVSMINDLQSNIYTQELNINRIKRNIRARLRNYLNFPWVLPKN